MLSSMTAADQLAVVSAAQCLSQRSAGIIAMWRGLEKCLCQVAVSESRI
jgi:hypothetical protein